MKERGILFKDEMVRATLEGRKSQTRRLVKPQPGTYLGGVHANHTAKHPAPYIDAYCGQPKTEKNPRGQGTNFCWWTEDDRQGPQVGRCPYGQPGDRLWVRETWCLAHPDYHSEAEGERLGRPIRDGRWCHYAATDDVSMDPDGRSPWRPSIHMPRWASRLTLEVAEIRVERSQDISPEDARDEGITVPRCPCESCSRSSAICPADGSSYIEAYRELWDRFNGKTAPWSSNPWVWVVSFRRAEDQNNGCRSGCGRSGDMAESSKNACAKEGSRTPTGITPQEPESSASVTFQPKTSVSAETARQGTAVNCAAMTDCGGNSQKDRSHV